MAEGDVRFTVNGKPHRVSGGESWLTLADYIRDVARLKGTKITCRHGGCGACAVVVTRATPGDGSAHTFEISSCICPVYLADGWAITTVEGLGNRKAGYHPIQTRLADYNASQCGFCTPGMTMALYGALTKCTKPCGKDLERSLDGHICRCTGYRPILSAVNSFAKEADLRDKNITDIEDLQRTVCLKRNALNSGKNDGIEPRRLTMELGAGRLWYKARTLGEVLEIQNQHLDRSTIRLVSGHTSAGVFPEDMSSSRVLVDISSVPELHMKEIKNELILGAGVSLTSLCEMFSEIAAENTSYVYLRELARAIERVGNSGVRNLGTWAGNLMMQYHHPNFPSDISVILEAVGARLEICDSTGIKRVISLGQLWRENMKQKVILNMRLSPMTGDTIFRTFKITNRSTNSYATVNAAFKMDVQKDVYTVSEKPMLVYGCVGDRYVHAEKTEDYLVGRCLTNAEDVTEALHILRSEIDPPDHVMSASPEYRRDVAVVLLYKFFLEVVGDKLPEHLRSGAGLLERPLSRGQQEYQVKDGSFGTPVPKRGIIQHAAGETRYVGDIPRHEGEVNAAYVLSTIAMGTIDKIDVTEALSFPGVLSVLTAQDLAIVETDTGKMQGVKTLSDGKIEFMHEPVAMVIAESQLTADLAAEHVKVSYKEVLPAVMDIHQAIHQNSEFPGTQPQIKVGDVEGAFDKCDSIEQGQVSLGVQEHFHLETQTCLCVPHEDTMDVWSSTQATDRVQHGVAKATGRAMNSVHVTVPSVGGAFGGKEMMPPVVAASVAAAADIMDRPVRMAMSLKDNLKTGMKRSPVVFKYKVGFDKNGKIQAVSTDVYLDCGSETLGAPFGVVLMKLMDGVYTIPNWLITCHLMKTNHRPRTFMRSPAHLPAVYFIETVMDHVAKVLARDPLDLRLLHLRQPGEDNLFNKSDADFCMRELWEELRVKCDYVNRKRDIQEYNKANLWRKRGMSVVPSAYQVFYFGFNQSCFLAVYEKDGSVAVSHGGTEMGQGINTKVCQAVAHTLGIPVDLVHCQPVNSLVGANTAPSSVSVTSELAVKAAIEAGKILLERMAPIKERNPGATWQELVSASHFARVDLTVQYRCFAPEFIGNYQYITYGICVAEAEIDILTGQYQISRVDILMDLGESVNPMLDIGQIEGAFVMGMGYMTTEKEILDPKTGAVLSTDTQSYRVPMAQDTPADFRISLRKDSENKLGVTRSRAVGEPPITMSPSVVFAIRAAVEASREQRGYNPEFLKVDIPLTPDQVQRLAGVRPEELAIQ